MADSLIHAAVPGADPSLWRPGVHEGRLADGLARMVGHLFDGMNPARGETAYVVEFTRRETPILHTALGTAVAGHPLVRDAGTVLCQVNAEQAAVMLVVAEDGKLGPEALRDLIEEIVPALGGTFGERGDDIHASWERTNAIAEAVGYDGDKDPEAKVGGYYGLDLHLSDLIAEAGATGAMDELLETLGQAQARNSSLPFP